MEALRVERLSKDFGGLHALKDISFSVAPGERLAIIGPNGAGKTTLFNLLTGQLSPTAGQMYFFGQDITHMPIHKRVNLGLGRSFQITNLFPNLTVLDNALLALQGTKYHRYQMFRPIKAYQDVYGRAKELLEPWGLWEKREGLVRNIAYGDQRALEIVLTLASKPKVLLLDEPSSGLTATQSADIVSRIRELGTDVTVLFVAHDMDLVFGVADRICVLHYGEVIGEGSCEEIRVDAKVKEIYMGTGEMTHDTRAS